jgi:hypothetical protein
MYEWIEKIEVDILMEILGDLMSNISEECYSAGWYQGSEYIIPALCEKALNTQMPKPWARGEVTPEMASLLVSLAGKIGGWVSPNKKGDGYKIFNPFPTPEKYEDEIEFWKNKQK